MAGNTDEEKDLINGPRGTTPTIAEDEILGSEGLQNRDGDQGGNNGDEDGDGLGSDGRRSRRGGNFSDGGDGSSGGLRSASRTRSGMVNDTVREVPALFAYINAIVQTFLFRIQN